MGRINGDHTIDGTDHYDGVDTVFDVLLAISPKCVASPKWTLTDRTAANDC